MNKKDREPDETVRNGDPETGEDAGERPYTLMDAVNDVEPPPPDGRAADVLASLRRSLETLVGARPPTSARQAESLDIARCYSDLVRNRTRSRLDARRGQVRRGPRKIDEVPLSSIIVGEKIQNARVRRDEEQHQALRSSVAEDGIDTPVGLLEDEIRPGKYHLIFGEGRVDAARDVGLAVIPALILPAGTPQLDLELAHLRENTCRSNLTSYETAARCAHLIDTYGCTTASLAKHIGVAEGSIRALISILSRLPPAIIDAWKNGAPELDRRTLQRLAEQCDHEAALTLWAERRAALAAADTGKSGRRKRFRPPNSRPTAQTLSRLCHALRTSGRESFTREEAVSIVEFAVGIASEVPNIFTPPARHRGRRRDGDERRDRELLLPEPGRALDVGEPGLALGWTADLDDGDM